MKCGRVTDALVIVTSAGLGIAISGPGIPGAITALISFALLAIGTDSIRDTTMGGYP